ncbi:MAG: hypothetical protein ACO4CI_07690, partial [Phycisphaerales bacterium]
IGRFRLSLTAAPDAAKSVRLPTAIQAILAQDRAERSAADARRLDEMDPRRHLGLLVGRFGEHADLPGLERLGKALPASLLQRQEDSGHRIEGGGGSRDRQGLAGEAFRLEPRATA